MALRDHKMRFPGETARYRTSRNRLLEAERDLRRQVERVAAVRRKLPPGTSRTPMIVHVRFMGPSPLPEF